MPITQQGSRVTKLNRREIPTPRHSLRDAVALGIDPAETDRALSIQERAYTSPIHYRP